MNKKLLVAFLATISTFALAFGLSACGEKPHEHIYETTVTAPTCTEQGYTTHTCSCGDSYVDSYVNALGHNFANYVSDGNATYEKDGTKTAICDREGCNVTDTVTDEGSKLKSGISFKTLSVTGTDAYGKVSNTTETFSFINEVVAVGTAKYVVALDIYGSQQVVTKTIPLSIGDNTVYIIETIDGEPTNVYTVTVRRRPMYEVTFNTSGGSTVESQTVEEDSFATEPETTRTGYTFTGWGYDFTQPITQTTKITASWSVNKDTKYTVKYYLQNLGDNEYAWHETVELTGETDTTAYGETERYAHFTYNASKSVISGNINGDGSRVLSVYYTRDNYDIIANNNNAKAGTATSVNGTYRYEKEFTLTATTNAGYTWLGWYDGETLACEAEEFKFTTEKDVTYTATWSANTDTKYTVIYCLQNLDDNNYTPYETVELTGETDTTAYGETERYAHFTYNASKSVISGNINGDGSRVLSVYYTRDNYDIIANNNNAKAGTATSVNGTYRYEKEFTLTATTDAGYTWLGWYDGETLACATEEFTFKTEKDVTYTATWSANTDTKYTVIYYLQNLNDNNYTPYETVELTGETDTPTAEVDIREYTHFTYNASKSVISGNIDGNGNRVLSVYYTRNTYTLSVNSSAGVITNAGAYKYGTEVTSTVTPHLGYEFIGWYNEQELLSADLTYTFTATQNATAKFEAKEEMSNFNFTSTTTACSITSIKDNTVMEIVFPYYVTGIGSSAFYGCNSLTSITVDANNPSYQSIDGNLYTKGGTTFIQYAIGKTATSFEIPDSVTSIGSSAFEGCSSLTSVVIPDSVTSIGSSAFYNCDSLTSVDIGDSVTSIGSYAFYDCSSLAKLNYNATACADLTISDDVFHNAGEKGDGITVTIGANVTKIPAYLFYSYYPYDTFSYVPKITSVVFEEGSVCESIGSYVFYYCSSLTSITIPDSVTSMGSSAFSGCSSLTEITLPFVGGTKGGTSNTHFGYIFGASSYSDNSRYVPTSLKKVTITSVTSIGEDAFYNCSSLTSVTIPDSVTSIGDSAFSNCTGLTEINYNATECADLSYGNGVFYSAGQSGTGITVTIGANVKKIPAYLFSPYKNSSYAPKITSVVFEEGSVCESIGNYAFAYCSGLTSVVIPDSVTSIGEYAFSNCSSLTIVTIGNSVTSIGYSVFYNCTGLTEINYNATECANLSYDNEVFFKAGQSGTGITVTIGANVKKIPAYLFYLYSSSYAPKITSVVFEEGSVCESIGNYAFAYCSSLESVTIPDSVTSIGDSAFGGCRSLTSVTIPFVGATKDGTSNTHFGYIFGASLSSNNSSYVPSSLKTVVITGGTSIGSDAFRYCSGLTSVVIPDSVTSIGEYAFYNCSSLTSVTIGNSVTSIGYSAFYNCSSLTSVTFGENSQLTSIGEYAFYECSSLTNATIPDSVTSIGWRAFYNTAYYNDSNNWENDVLYIGKHLIEAKNTLSGAYTIKDGTLTIADAAFRGCSSLTSITIPDSVTSIDGYAFFYCYNLTSVTIGNSVTSIGEDAFYNCSSLKSVTIGNSVTSIGDSAFYDCSSLKSVYITNITAWCNISFGSNYTNPLSNGASLYLNNELVTELVIPDSVTRIGDSAFSNCSSLESVTIPDSVTSIGEYAFYNCSNLTSITIGNGVTSIGNGAFSSCDSLMSVTFGENSQLTSIGNSAFYYCSKLTSITIPDSVTSIGNSAFRYCNSLTSVTIGDGVTSIGALAFCGCSSLTSILVDENNQKYKSIDGNLYTKDGATLIQYAIGKTQTSFVIPDSVTSIGNSAFSNCSGLKSITIPDSVTSIGYEAFYCCSNLTSVTIPDSVTSIGDDTFEYCGNLTSVYITDIAVWCNISFGNYSANPLYYAHNLYLNNELVTEITIPDSVTSIGDYAFYNCNSLTSVTIGNSVTSIGPYAFYNCSSLTIYCEAASKPIGWGLDWNYSNRPVVWGWTGEEYTYTFETNGGSDIENVTSNMKIILPTPTKDGWYFGGWYDNAELTGSPVSSPYYSATNTALYAEWLTEQVLDGSSFEKAKQAESGGSYTVTIDAAGEKVYYKFTATESRSYTIKSSGGLDTCGYLYDSSKSQLTYNDRATDFTITHTLTAGETYYVVVEMYSSTATGTFTLTIS